jgi:type IV secretion system protein VirB10
MSTPPPPPDDPFAAVPPDGVDPFVSNVSDDEDISTGAPAVAAKPGRMLTVLGILVVVLGLLFYLIFGSGKKDQTDGPPVVSTVSQRIEPPPLPQPIETTAPPAFLPPTIPAPAKIPMLEPENDGADEKARLARLRSAMLTLNESGSGLFSGSDAPPAGTANNDPNSAFAAATITANTKAQRVQATHIGNLRRTIAQGRIIQATMESALNTELPAPIRAIVSRDVYGEAGSVPLIPKGSRLIGSYNTAIGAGQSRVFVVWTRVIRPDGVDVMINSPLVDQIGQAGVGGQVDSKFQEIFSRSVMASVVGIAFAIGTDKISGGETTTSNTASGTSTTGDVTSTATVNALNRLGATTDSFLQKLIGVNPSILVDQGTPVNVFVNRDLVFPAEYVGGGRVVE